MKQTSYYLILSGMVLGVLVGAFYFSNASKALAGVDSGSEYNATTTTSTQANTHRLVKTTTISPVCTIGSVVIASSSATAFTVWNATSTTDVASTTFATFEANAVEGTYAFDSTCTRGIVIAAPTGFNGSVVTTYR